MQSIGEAFSVSWDIEPLYTNIEHVEGLEALKHYLQQRPEHSMPRSDFIVSLTEWTLKNNVFLLQDKLFRQQEGTAMGAAYALSWPMGRETHLQSCQSLSGQDNMVRQIH